MKRLWQLVVLCVLCVVPGAAAENWPLLSLQESTSPQQSPVLAPQEVDVVAAPSGWDLAALLDQAAVKNPQLITERSRIEASRRKIEASGLMPNPMVEGGAKKVSGGDTGPLFEVSQEVPLYGVLGLSRQAAAYDYQSAQADYSRRRQEILKEVAESYIDVLMGQEKIALEERNEQISQRSLDVVTDRVRAGLAATMPVHLAKADHAAARLELRNARADVVVARKSLAGLMGLDESQVPQVLGVLGAPFLTEATNLSNSSRPDLNALAFRAQAVHTEGIAEGRSKLPHPTLRYMREEAGDETDNYFTIGFEIPIFNNGGPAYRQKAAEAQALQNDRSALRVEIETQQQQALERLEAAREVVRLYEQEVSPALQDTLAAAESAFNSGTTDLSLLLQTQNRIIEMDRKRLTSLGDLRKAELEYLLALGVPLR